jgi:hypothetical protein
MCRPNQARSHDRGRNIQTPSPCSRPAMPRSRAYAIYDAAGIIGAVVPRAAFVSRHPVRRTSAMRRRQRSAGSTSRGSLGDGGVSVGKGEHRGARSHRPPDRERGSEGGGRRPVPSREMPLHRNRTDRRAAAGPAFDDVLDAHPRPPTAIEPSGERQQSPSRLSPAPNRTSSATSGGRRRRCLCGRVAMS